jgi:uncharacterized protein (TIGR02117 family)
MSLLRVLIAFACVAFLQLEGKAGGSTDTRPVWLVSNGFHSSLAFRASDVPALAKLTAERRPSYVLIGWGEADFYRFPATPWLLVKAVFWPTDGALHVVPVRGSLTDELANSDIVRFDVAPANFAKLQQRIDRHIARDSSGAAVPLGKGYRETSRFYLSRESFYFPKMCNMWTAQALRTGGVKVVPSLAISAQQLQWQTEPQGRRLNRRKRPLDAF